LKKTRTALIALDAGVIIVRISEGAQQHPADARQNLAACLELAGDRRRPLLIDIRRCRPLDADTRHTYSGQTLTQGFTALALLIESSPLGKMMGNVYFRVARPGIPTRLFSDEPAALDWLREHVE
jgi:hypothetical protein